MNPRTIFLSLCLPLLASFGQDDTFTLQRKYAVGDKDEYAVKMKMDSNMGAINISMSLTEEVKKVYDNGEAEIESRQSDLVMNVMGREIKPPTPAPTSSRVSATGKRVNGRKANMDFGDLIQLPANRTLKVGEAVSFDEVDKEKPKNHVKGSIKLLSLDKDLAVVEYEVDSFTEASDTPMHVKGKNEFFAATGRLKSVHAELRNMPSMGQGAPQVPLATLTMDHK